MVVRQNRSRGTLGQLAQVPLLRRSYPTTEYSVTLHSGLARSAYAGIPFLNDPRNSKTSPPQLPTNQTGTGTAVTGTGEARWTLNLVKVGIVCGLHAILGQVAGMSQD